MRLLYKFALLFALFAQSYLSAQVAVIGAGATNAASANWGPIYRSTAASAFDYSQHFILYTQAELQAAGITPGSNITAVAWNKTNTGATTVGNNSSTFKIYMKNSGAVPSTTWSSGNFATQATGATLVYDNPNQTISALPGFVTFTLSAPFVYTGGSLEIGCDWNCSAFAGNPTDAGFNWARDPITNQVFGSSASTSTMTMTNQTSRSQIQITYNGGSACSGMPNAGNTQASTSNVCPGVPFNLSLSGATAASGLTYQWQSSPDGINFNDISGATNPSYSTNISVNTHFRCQVTCLASLQTATSTPVMVAVNNFQNCYCTSNATSTLDEDIIGVHVAGLSNTSTCTTTGGPGSITQQYSNYMNLPPTALARTVSYPFTIDIGTCGTGSYNNMVKVFIDFNQNGLFTDAGEQVYVSPAATLGAHSETFTLQIPIGAALGVTRMRIVNVETSSATAINPCGTYTWGETEDYLVEIFPIPTCPQPTALTVLSTTTSSASLDWTPGGAETKWQLRYGPQGFNVNSAGTSVLVHNSSDTILGGLTANNFFDVYVRGICGAGDTSLWTPKKSFNTYGLGQYMEMELVCDTGGFFDISGMFTANPLATDGEAGFMLPWPFYFQGAEVNQVTIGNNGAIVFNTITAQISPTNANTLATTAAIGLYPFWDDLDDNTAAIYWGSVGNAPNRRFIIQWNAKHDLFLSGTPFVFQIILEESTGKIYYQYNNRVTGSTTYDYGASATIGIAGTSQDFALSFNNNSWLTNNSCAQFYYTNCPKPVNLVYSYITPEEAAIDWGAGLFGENQWTLIYGPAGFNPATGGTTQVYSTSDAILTGLSQLTTYDIYIYANCSVGNNSYALKGTFTTLPFCSNPTSFTAAVAPDSIFTNWNWSPSSAAYPSTGFEVRYGVPGFDPLLSGVVDLSDNVPGDTSADAGLFAGGVYEVYLRGVCDTLVSGFVGPLTVTMPLSNNNVCGAEVIPVDGTNRIFSNAGATIETNEQSIAPPIAGNNSTAGWGNNILSFTTWHKFIAPSSGEMRIDGTGRSFNGQMAVYQVVSCSDFTSFNFIAGNDDAIGGGSLAPNFTVCGLTPGAEYFLLFDSYSTTATGQYALKMSSIDLEAGSTSSLVKVCFGDTANLYEGITGFQSGGVWLDIDGTNKIVQDTLFRATGIAAGTYQFEYRLTDGCATDAVIGNFQVFNRASAGTDGALEVCKHEPIDVISGLSGTIQTGGQWYDAMGAPINTSFVGAGVLNVAGTFNYSYIVGNNVCPNDTAFVSVNVKSTCDFLGVAEMDDLKIQLYPNPTSGQLTLNLGESQKDVQIEVVDLNGKIVLERYENEIQQRIIDLSHLEKGTYFVKLVSNQMQYQEKIIIQ